MMKMMPESAPSLPSTPTDPGALLAAAVVPDRVIDDFRPLTDTLEWRLADVHWAREGLRPFAENQVPHLVTSSGRLSHKAAAVVYHSCLASPPTGTVDLLELGAGSGLFARFFLDEFRRLCEASGRDFYQRLRYRVTDRSPRTIEQWAEHGLFAAHGERVLPGTCDALRPAEFRGAAADPPETLRGLRAVLCNYLLDTLPARLLRRSEDGIRELQVRTHLCPDDEVVRTYTRLTIDELRALAQSPEPAARAQLVPLLSLLLPEVAYRPAAPADIPFAEEALALLPEHEQVLVSGGALRCLEACLPLLAPDGFVLINDYGPVAGVASAPELLSPLRLGATMALGINFPLIDAYFARRGLPALTPPGDEALLLHARLLPARLATEPLAAAFGAAFGIAAQQALEGPLAEARTHLSAGRLEDALGCYRAAVALAPRDFLVLGEVAEFAVSHLRDAELGRALATDALAHNPWTSGWLWNLLGECLATLGRIPEAHEAHLRAAQIHPGDPRAHLNLSLTLTHQGRLEDALVAVARGLAADGQGHYRARLLDRQQQLLMLVQHRALGEQERLVQRNDRLRVAL